MALSPLKAEEKASISHNQISTVRPTHRAPIEYYMKNCKSSGGAASQYMGFISRIPVDQIHRGLLHQSSSGGADGNTAHEYD